MAGIAPCLQPFLRCWASIPPLTRARQYLRVEDECLSLKECEKGGGF